MDDEELERWARRARPALNVGDLLVTAALWLVFIVSAFVVLAVLVGAAGVLWAVVSFLWDLLGRPEEPLPCHPGHC